MNVCRIGEFAWSTMEPGEGSYDFGWMERAIALLHSNGIAVVLGTPTAAPPAWLTHHHPDTLATEPSGRLAQHGNRCHFNPGSVTYLRYVRRIVEQMARRFGQDTRVIGWQIDNEYNRVDYSEDTGRRFQAFIKEQYGSLDALNTRWSTAYWSQSYTDWSEIPMPIGPHNPGLMLAFKHFVTRVWRDYQKLQCEIIRAHARPDHWITHNFMGWFDAFDHYTVTRDLDMASWDWYVGTGHHSYADSAAVHDLTRGFKRKNFWVMETQPGCVNWSANNNMLNRGEARCMAWHAVAHGAEAILYWQWRSAPGGQEQLHGSLLGADGNPRPFYTEAQQLGSDFASIGDALAGTQPINEVAVLHSYDSRWSIDAQRHNAAFDPVDVLRRYTRPLATSNIGVDIVDPEGSLEGYRLVIAPALAVLSETASANIVRYVEGGGTLVLTVRCGQKDAHNALFPHLQPGPLREAAGVEVEEYFALDAAAPVICNWNDAEPGAGESHIWAERLKVLDSNVKVVATFGTFNGWLDGGAAVTLRSANSSGGQVVTVGVLFDDETQKSLTDWLIRLSGVRPVWPDRVDGVEFARRTGEGKAYLFVINHTAVEKQVSLNAASARLDTRDLLTGEQNGNRLKVPAYGVCVFATQDTR
jgi:beta-galactosidase